MKKIAADKNYRMFKRAQRSPKELIQEVLEHWLFVGMEGPGQITEAAEDILATFEKNNLYVTPRVPEDEGEPFAG
jgi:hypothetical protein